MTNRTYKFFQGTPLYPFGYGLSYTNFSYDNLRIPDTIEAGETFEVSVAVTNTGQKSGMEVVQLYIKDLEASDRVPIRSLNGFEKVSLEPGETKTVTFQIDPLKLANVTADGKYVVEPGDFEISVGGEQPGYSGALDTGTTTTVSGKVTVSGNDFEVNEVTL
jgi:beta-glucosidase